MRFAPLAPILVAFVACATSTPRPAAQNAAGPQMRVIEFGDHPDPNTGTPKVVQNAQPWPHDVMALVTAVKDATGRPTTVYDMRHGTLAPGAVQQLEETNVRVIQTSAEGARVLVTMESSPTTVETFIPLHGTAVIGSDSVDEHHAYVAVSLLDAKTDHEIFSPREPGVTAPVKISGALPAATPTAIEHRLRGVVVDAVIDENGNVVAAHAIMGRYPSEADERAIEETIRTWRFRPAMRDGSPVAVVTNVAANFAR
jgi:Gram-negative bacterial TonB protein C-terminal